MTKTKVLIYKFERSDIYKTVAHKILKPISILQFKYSYLNLKITTWVIKK